MTVLSILKATAKPSNLGCFFRSHLQTKVGGQQQFRGLNTSLVRFGGGHDRTMVVLPSRFQWQKYKDDLHFYIFLGLIPVLSIVFYSNVFIGPATLSEVPCNYEPKHWEYYRHPISRFFSKYLIVCQQQAYERNLHYIKEIDEEMRIKRISTKIDDLMRERGDYPNYYASKLPVGKYIRAKVKEDEYIEANRGSS